MRSLPLSLQICDFKTRLFSWKLQKVSFMLISCSTNRYSMPVTSSFARKRESVPEYSAVMGVGHINTTGFLFGDDDEKAASQHESATSPDVSSYLQMNTTDDKFPILIRNNHHPGLVGVLMSPRMSSTNAFLQLSASSAALDLALSQSPGPESESKWWNNQFTRHRPSQHSLPQNVYDLSQSTQHSLDSPNSASQVSIDTQIDSPVNVRLNRHSMEATLASYTQKNLLSNLTNGASSGRPSLANLQSSYSTNDIPTLKNSNGLSTPISPPKHDAKQQFHNHNASLGRIPAHAMNSRHSRDMSNGDIRREEQSNGYKTTQSELQASAAPFGPSTVSNLEPASTSAGMPSVSQYSSAPAPAYYGGYGMQLMNVGMTPVPINSQLNFNNQLSLYQPQNSFPSYSPYNQVSRVPDSQARVIQQRRMQNNEGK